MEDLESAVMEIVGVDLQNTANSDFLICLSVEEDTASSVAKESINQSGATSSFWPPKAEEFVSILLQDGFYIAQVNIGYGQRWRRKSGLSKNLSWKSILLKELTQSYLQGDKLCMSA